jgi:tetratricopeptide (TPR) repeat protein
VTQEFDCAVSTGSSWRVGDDAAWVINVGGRAILLRTVLVYRKNNPPPGEVQPVFGEAFTYFPKVTHPFNELPKTVSVKGSESRTLAKLEVFHGDPRDVIAHFAANNRPDEALRACEWLLGINPGDEFALEQYSGIAAAKFPGRAERFLAAGLDRRPVNVQWHRVYQSMALVGGKREDLAKLYDGMLAKEPGSSALIYLRGRIIEDPVQSRAHYERALAADGTNPWPSYALGSIAADEGDWKTARPHAERAALAAPQNLEFRSRVRDAMLGERDFAALESDFRNGLKANPNDFASFAGLVETLVAAGNVEGAKTAADEFIKRVARITGGGAEVARSARVFTALATGDHAAAERLAGPAGGFLLQALVAQDKIEPAERLARDPYARLLVALAWHLRGDTARFAQWRETAATAFAGDPGTREVAALLRDPGPVAPARLARIPWPARQKAVLAAVLAASHPPGDGMRALARRLNIGVVMPAPLVARFLDAAR